MRQVRPASAAYKSLRKAERAFDDQSFIHSLTDLPVGGLDYVSAKGTLPDGVAPFFKGLKANKGQRLIVFGWAMAEDLASGKLPK